jgi:UDP-N-acetylglucosamine pyrophosphorylase
MLAYESQVCMIRNADENTLSASKIKFMRTTLYIVLDHKKNEKQLNNKTDYSIISYKKKINKESMLLHKISGSYISSNVTPTSEICIATMLYYQW